MPEPVLFVVDDDHEALAAVGAALQRRFGADYRIVTNSSPSAGLAWLEEAGTLGETVALVLYPVVTEILCAYILTGSSVVRGLAGEPPWPEERPPHQLETSLPGVFAAGDVRYRSPRGVAAAVADGALAARSIYEYLAVPGPGVGGH